MSFIQREIDRLHKAVLATPDDDQRREVLYAAQQALSWALEPGGIMAPYEMITGTAAEPGGCSARSRQPPS